MMEWDQVWQALLIGAPSFALGYLAYRRSKKVDAVTAQSGAVTETRMGMAQIIDGLNQHIDNLQDDNRSFREDIRSCAVRLDLIIKERDDLRTRLNRMSRRYGDNGLERPGDTPPFGSPTT